MSRSCLLLMALFACATCVAATSVQPDAIEPDSGSLVEFAKTGGTELSGDLLAGAMRGSGSFDGHQVYVRIPSIQRPIMLRLRIRTNDGLYDGKATYTVPVANAGKLVALKFLPKKKSFADLPAGRMVGLIVFQDESSETVVLPCRWKTDAASEKAVVYLNSSSAADGGTLRVSARQLKATDEQSIRCEKLSDSFIFDACFGLDSSDASAMAITVVRKYEGQIRDSVSFKLQ